MTTSAESIVPTPTDWSAVPEILGRIHPPRFPARDFLLPEFGGRCGPEADNTGAFAAAIEACHAAGGGRVVVPAGEWHTGPIHLRSRVCLHVMHGAFIRFSPDPAAYLPVIFTRWEGIECFNYSSLVHACDAEDVAITGGGVLDGRAAPENWWSWKGSPGFGWHRNLPHQQTARARLIALAEAGVPPSQRHFGVEAWLRPMFVQFYRCRNVLIEGIALRASPMWVLHPVLCRNVTVRGVTVDSRGPNNDGCNPESCCDVLIEDCVFSCGDDCVAIKSGRNADGHRLAAPSENIVVRRCRMHEGHGGVVIGSEVSGGCRNVFVEDCVMNTPSLERVFRIKTNSHRGGRVENVFIRRIEAGEISDAVVRINFYYEEGDGGPRTPEVCNIQLDHVHCEGSQYALFLAGYARSPIRGVRLRDCRFGAVERPSVLHHVADLTLERVEQNFDVPLAEMLLPEA